MNCIIMEKPFLKIKTTIQTGANSRFSPTDIMSNHVLKLMSPVEMQKSRESQEMKLLSSGIASNLCEYTASGLTLTHICGLQPRAQKLGSAAMELEISPQYYSYGHI